MKIISREHDYYDSVRGYDRDDSLIFKREETYLSYGEMSQDNASLLGDAHRLIQQAPTLINIYDYRPSVLYFCGKVYVMYERHYTFDAIHKSLLALDKKSRRYDWYDVGSLLESFSAPEREQRRRRTLFTPFSYNEFKKKAEDSLLAKEESYAAFGVPYFSVHTNQVILCPQLSRFDFETQMGPFEAFQEISMFLANNIVNVLTKEPRPISDKLRAETKGFNDLSFRKEKTKDKSFRRRRS